MASQHTKDFLYHALPNWISAICAISVLALTAYTLLGVHKTVDKVNEMLSHMGPPQAGGPPPPRG